MTDFHSAVLKSLNLQDFKACISDNFIYFLYSLTIIGPSLFV
jgi:hypothetical protein